MSNEFDDAVTASMQPDQGQAARIGFSVAADTNPDAYAEARRVARRTGVPVDTVLAMPKEMQRQDAMGTIDFDALAKTSPATAAILADVERAKISHDNLPSMTAIERSFIGNITEPVQRGISQGRQGLTHLFDQMGIFNGIERRQAEAAAAHGISYDPSIDLSVRLTQQQREAERYPVPEDIARGMQEIGSAKSMSEALAAIRTNPRAVLETTLQSLGASSPALAMSIGGSAFGPVGTAAGAGIGSFAVEYGSTMQDVIDQSGIDTTDPLAVHAALNNPELMAAAREKALKRGIPVAAFDALTAGIAGKLLAAAKPTAGSVGGRALGELAIQAGGGAAGEAGAQLATGEYKPGDILMEAFAEMPTALIEAPSNYRSAMESAQRAQSGAEFIDNINKLVQADKLLGRDPDTFEQFVAQAAEAGPVQQVFIDAQTLMQSGVAEQVSAVSPSVAAQIGEALQTGGQISIPVEEYATRIAPTEYAQSLVDHLKTEPGGFSRAEAQDFMQNHAEELQTEVERILSEKQDDDTFKASAEVVKNTVKDQLTVAGRFTESVNDAYSSMVSNFFAVQAARMGTTPEEMFSRYPLRIGAESVAGQQFDQSALRIVDEIGNGNKVDYHDDAKGLIYSAQKFPTGTRWSVFEKFPAEEGGNQALGEMFKYKSLDEAKSAVRGLRISATQKLKNSSKYGAIPNLWKGEEKKIAKALIDAGISIDRFASSTQSRSKYIYLDSGLKVRLADHALPSAYDRPDIDYRYGNDIKALVEEVKKAEESAPTHDSSELGSQALSNQDAGAISLRADKSGRLMEPAQFEGGDGSNANITGSYNQSNGARGSFSPATLQLTLLKNADLSTFLHESAHFFLEVQADIAAQPDAPEQVKRDMQATLDWFGVKDLAEWSNLDFEEKRSYHEKFARGFEAYLFEGKAPSIELQGLFQRFRAWMLNVYRDLKALNVELTDEVRGVFDRMLATNEQITLAEQGRSMMPLFTSPEQIGMTPAEFADYQALGTDATNEAIEDLQARGLRDMQWIHNARGRIIKKLQKESSEKRAEVQMDVRREVMAQPIYQAWQFLTGKAGEKTDAQKEHSAALSEWNKDRADYEQKTREDLKARLLEANPDTKGIQRGQLLAKNKRQIDIDTQQAMLEWDKANRKPEAPAETAEGKTDGGFEFGRLDLDGLKDIGLPVELINHLKALRMTAQDGFHPDIVAEMFGFSSGDELVRRLAAAESPKAEIDALTDQRMLEQFGELSSEDAIEKAADKAIHNDVRARMIATEANALAKATGKNKVLASAAKQFAADMISRLKVRNIKPGQYASAEVRAAKAAEKASKSGDMTTAAAEKRNQLIQNYATRAAYDAQDEVDNGLRYLKKFDGDIKKLDADYAEQIRNILERFDLRKGQSNKSVDRRTALSEWIKSQRDAGLEPDIPPELENEAFRTSYKNLTVEEFRGIVDAVKQIEHLGRLKHKLLTAKDQRAYEAVRDEIVGSIRENANGREADTRTPTTNMGRTIQGLKRFWASHIKAATWARVMDGGKDGGPMWEYFVRSANERGDQETTMRAEATAALSEILAPVFKLGKMGGKGQFFPSINRSLNREARIAIALNTGNAGNLQRLLGGEGWTMAQLAPVLQSLTAQEWKAVQAVWDHFDSYRQKIADKERRVYGKEPDWVDPQTFAVVTSDGETLTLRGGYYPIKYDPAASQRAEEHSDAEGAKRQLQGAYTTATTRRSFTKSRVEEVSGRPLLYTLAGMYSGVNDVIHDLAWHEWLIDANRLLRSQTIDAAIREHYGPEAKQQFKTWVQDVAEGDKAAANAGEAALGRLRQGVSASGLGFNAMSAAIQVTGFNQSIVRIGAKWVGRGVAKYIGNPVGLTRQVHEMSEFMANRARTRFRELNELRNQVQDQSAFNEFIGRYAYFMMMRVQQVVDVPTWWGAYEKAIAAGNEESRAIALADQAVIDAQGGGQTKDLSAIERGGPALRLFTVFYSFMNTALNLGVAQTMTANTPAKRAKLAVDYLMLYTVPAVLGYTMKAALTPGDSGDDDLEEIAKKLAAEQLSYLMGIMVVVREFGEVAKIATGNQSFGYQGPAGVRAISDAQKFGQQAMQVEFDDAFRKAAVNLLGDFTGLPAAQINRTITGTKALADGKTENPAAVAFGFQEKR